MHTSVYLNEAVDALNVVAGKKYVDATFGQGGHARLIAESGGVVIGIDQDKNQVALEKKLKVYEGNFRNIDEVVFKHGWTKIDGVIFDLGLSMHQLKSGNKGLSFKNDDEVLDMRLSSEGKTASEYLNEVELEELSSALSKNSEDLNSLKIAREIFLKRKNIEIWTVGQLKNAITKATGLNTENAIKTFARIFQALRMIVNDELASIREGLIKACNLLNPGGVMVVITFHSVEDRVVKQIFNNLKEKGEISRIGVARSRKLLSFERSATLRIFKKHV
jgi:16S rRNA (cytosine1402-N4)-methyltransferase